MEIFYAIFCFAAEECCSESGQMLPEENLPSNCLVIEIPEDDEFYGDFNRTCFGLTRAATAESAKCAPSSPVHQVRQCHHAPWFKETSECKLKYSDFIKL